ncbi:MAG: hypothetical protein F6K58_28050, partial [Symploca sp. SIO2E9]|nr:hypothetical protein [Symploca sp. SIO2E9]
RLKDVGCSLLLCNIEIAIAGDEVLSKFYTRHTSPYLWAIFQNWGRWGDGEMGGNYFF